MEALRPGTEWEVTEVRERTAFLSLAEEWDALVDAVSPCPFFRHHFIRVWLDNFAPGGRWRVLVARDRAGRLAAALPLVEERTTFYGLPVTCLNAAANAHSCRFDLLALEPGLAAAVLMAHLAADRSWDLLRLVDVPEGGAAFALFDEARRRGFPVGTWESLRSPFIALPETWGTMEERLHGKFKANLRRRRKKLQEQGAVSFERFDGGELLDARLVEGFGLEGSGWKGQEGTAIAQGAATRGFYTELAQAAALRGELSLYFLKLEGRSIAFHYGLSEGARYYLLKPGYDEALKECSPGQLIMEEVIKDAIARGLSEVDFLGPDMVWKRDWTASVRVHTWLYVFSASRLGRALREAKFRWLPRAKEMVARWKR